VTVSPFPAGAPFLQEQALQLLLEQAHSGPSHLAIAPARAATPLPVPAPRVHAPVPTADIDVPAAVAEPMRQQLTSMVNSRSGWTYHLSRMVQPVTLVLVVIRDMILPRRG
jgi:hypothetical protein